MVVLVYTHRENISVVVRKRIGAPTHIPSAIVCMYDRVCTDKKEG